MEAEKHKIARHYGFETYADIIAISDPLPKRAGDLVQSYIAQHPNGHWFVWEDKPPPVADGDV